MASDQGQSTQNAESAASTQVALWKDGRGGLVGVKAGMTQIYTENGDAVAVTVIDLRPNFITQVKTNEKEGYSAIQIGVAEKRAKRATKAEQGHVKKLDKTGFYFYREFRLDSAKTLEGASVGQTLAAEFLKAGDLVDLTSVSKGKGFQGVMKRYHFGGGHKTHGASISHRQIGSIGNRADPGKVFKGKKMAGQMGHVQVTVQNVRVAGLQPENQVLLVHGSVPGPKGGFVTIRKAVKGS